MNDGCQGTKDFLAGQKNSWPPKLVNSIFEVFVGEKNKQNFM